MTRKTSPAIYICGGYLTHLEARGECPDPLHDWPLPAGYVEARDVAAARLRARWGNLKCRRCGLYGWQPGRQTASSNAIKVTLPSGTEAPD